MHVPRLYPGDEKRPFIREVAGSMSRLASREHALLVTEVTSLGNVLVFTPSYREALALAVPRGIGPLSPAAGQTLPAHGFRQRGAATSRTRDRDGPRDGDANRA